MDVYVNDLSCFLPNEPVNNDEIENVLGRILNIPSRTKRIVLKNNKIETRYYAIDPDTGRLTHTNAQLTAAAVQDLKPYNDFNIHEIECLCSGTTSPDIMLPGHALMVLGELGVTGCEAVTTAGICVSGMTAFKYAWMNVAAGLSQNAVSTGSELSSSYMRAQFFTPRLNMEEEDIEKRPIKAFDADFLRWMLSDGAGAAFFSPKPNTNRISLKVDWIENLSFAGELETCMYAGGAKAEDGRMIGWREIENIPKEAEPYVFSVRQDIKLLGNEIVRTAMDLALKRVIEKHNLTPDDVDWFLPHYSSGFFRDKFYEGLKAIGFEIPYEKWFTNLTKNGNTGSAAIYIILEELFHSGKLKPGEKLLCFIPESGRFSHCYMMLTVV